MARAANYARIASALALTTLGCSEIVSDFTFYDADASMPQGDAGTDAGLMDAASDAGDGGSSDAGCTGECVPGTTETGLNDCGNEAERTCYDTCEWSPFMLVESADTCDYCDDDPDGLREREAGFASVTRSYELASSVVTEGDAFGTCFGTECQIDLVEGAGIGGSFVPDPVVLGHEGGSVVLDMSATAGGTDPGLGWAFVAYAEPAPEPILGSASDLGVNLGADGFAIEWSVVGGDYIRLRSLDASGADAVVAEAGTGNQLAGPAGSNASQPLTITWTPDDPATPANETTVSVEHPCLVTPTCDHLGCGGTTGVPCGFSLHPGDSLRYGVVAASTAAFGARFRLYNSTIEMAGLCPAP